MHVTIPPSETERNIEAIKRAIDSKSRDVEQVRSKLNDLLGELRGLQAALAAINPKI